MLSGISFIPVPVADDDVAVFGPLDVDLDPPCSRCSLIGKLNLPAFQIRSVFGDITLLLLVLSCLS